TPVLLDPLIVQLDALALPPAVECKPYSPLLLIVESLTIISESEKRHPDIPPSFIVQFIALILSPTLAFILSPLLPFIVQLYNLSIPPLPLIPSRPFLLNSAS